MGDVIPYYEDGEFKLFYLHGWRDNYQEGLINGWYLGITDFCNYKEYGPCNIQGGTGDILKIDGLITCSIVSSQLHWGQTLHGQLSTDGVRPLFNFFLKKLFPFLKIASTV